jgi:hypothetical protein
VSFINEANGKFRAPIKRAMKEKAATALVEASPWSSYNAQELCFEEGVVEKAQAVQAVRDVQGVQDVQTPARKEGASRLPVPKAVASQERRAGRPQPAAGPLADSDWCTDLPGLWEPDGLSGSPAFSGRMGSPPAAGTPAAGTTSRRRRGHFPGGFSGHG